jgi:hypothetical protein
MSRPLAGSWSRLSRSMAQIGRNLFTIRRSALVPKTAPTILPKMLIRTSFDASARSVARSADEILTER